MATHFGGSRKNQRHGGLTEEQRQEIKEAFDLFDTEGAGNQPHLL
jgi:Ca2+-binding EF-hand superfamily protein